MRIRPKLSRFRRIFERFQANCLGIRPRRLRFQPNCLRFRVKSLIFWADFQEISRFKPKRLRFWPKSLRFPMKKLNFREKFEISIVNFEISRELFESNKIFEILTEILRLEPKWYRFGPTSFRPKCETFPPISSNILKISAKIKNFCQCPPRS